MINYALYKHGIKANYKVFLIFIAIISLYIFEIISIFDPELSGILAQFYQSMPQLMDMFGMGGVPDTLLGHCITYLYGFLFLVIPMVVTIIIANKLVASYTDKGSMAYLLSSPNARTKIIFTQMKVLGTFIFLLISFITITTIIVSEVMFHGELEIGKFLLLNIGLLVFHCAISGISFLSSVIANDTKYSLLFGAGIPVFFFLIQMLVNTGDKLSGLKYLTLFTLFNPEGIVNGDASAIVMIGVLAIIAIALYGISFAVFKKKDLSV